MKKIVLLSICVILSLNNKSSVHANGNLQTYTVKSGDTLFDIAFKHNISVSEFLKINNISDYNTYNLKQGAKLYVPNSSISKSTITYTVKSGDTLSEIAQRQGMSLSELYSINGINQSHVLKVGEKLKVYSTSSSSNSNSSSSSTASKNIVTYTVKSGDTLSEIAQRQGMSLSELYSINGINQSHVLKVGEKLKLYARITPTAQTTTEKHVITYVVKSGDSLLQIALRENMSLDALCKLNNIADANKHVLKVGDKIKIEKIITKTTSTSTNSSATVYPKADFAWPYRGNVTEGFGKNDKSIGNNGINISGKVGDNIYATLDGNVDYVGKVRGFGDVVIVKHKNDYSTIYAHLSESKLKAGDNVSKNDVIGKIGDSGFTDKNELHFKIFYKGQPVDPMKVLPKK